MTRSSGTVPYHRVEEPWLGPAREKALYALADYGFKVVPAESYGYIFYENAVKNGLISVKLDINTLQDMERNG